MKRDRTKRTENNGSSEKSAHQLGSALYRSLVSMSGGKPAASALAFAVNAMLTFHHMINIF
ncbi:hypothetical protein TYRP_000397 [Tyrophagus putrescentiae]|nr:hypothetical protein TYRP_000397 [Tyrophagus putrescentiae]